VTVAFIDAHRHRFPVAAMCRVLEFSERTFYAAKVRPMSARAVADIDRKTMIFVEWKANYSCYGARRLHKHLQRQGHTIARCTVARLMCDLDIRGVQRGRKQFCRRSRNAAGGGSSIPAVGSGLMF
jgi:putative transposase